MVVRIHNASKWTLLKAGDILKLAGLASRRVRLEVNCEAKTRFDLVVGDKATFLAVVEGSEALEFVAPAECHLVASSDGEVWFFTNDGDRLAVERPEAVSFATIWQRRARNPELEMMMFKMQQNINARMDAQAAEFAALMAAKAEEQGADPETGEVKDEGADDKGATGDDPSEGDGASEGGSEPELSGKVASAKPSARVPSGSKTA